VRTDDIFIPLRKRAEVAQKLDADLLSPCMPMQRRG
jgi:hypothetical protein